MSVMQRKLFANKEARTKLRDMGGIMSSFPELSGEVQRFQDGGGVESPPVTGSGMTPANVAPITYEQWQRMSPSARRAVGLPTSEIGAQLYFNRFGVGLGLNDPSTGERFDAVTPEMLDRQRRIEFAAQGEFAGLGDAEAGPPESRVEPPRPSVAAPEQGGDGGEDAEADAEAEAGVTTGVPLYEQGYQRIADLMPPAPDEGDEATDTDILRRRAEERIELFQDLFGSDEPTARDRAMQFAMIGLAIAAGQSPNALTNIASGLLAGTEAMSAQEAARRGERRDLRQAAVESVLDEINAEREAAAEALSGGAGFQDRESFEDTVRAVAAQLSSNEDLQYEDPEVLYARAWDLVTRMPAYASYRDSNPYTGGTGAAVPSDATEEEADMITGGAR